MRAAPPPAHLQGDITVMSHMQIGDWRSGTFATGVDVALPGKWPVALARLNRDSTHTTTGCSFHPLCIIHSQTPLAELPQTRSTVRDI